VATAQAVARLRLDRSAPAVAYVAGGTALLFLAVAVAAAHPEASPLSPDHPGGETRWSWLYLGAMCGAFASYVLGLAALARRAGRLAAVLGLAVAIQVLPLAGPVLLSTDVYTYWAYGRVGAVHGQNPYVVPPSRYPDDPAYAVMGEDWRDTTTVYGPGFTLASEAVAATVGESSSTVAWVYRGAATGAMLVIVGLAATLARRRALAAAFVGWNPLLAVHFAGGGHNDAWMIALVLAALALAAAGRRQLAGAAWVGSISIKWVPLAFLALRGVEARATRREVRHLGFALAAGGLFLLAYWRYGMEWIRAVVPLARNLEQQAVYSIPHRLSDLGVPERVAAGLFAGLFILAFVWLLLEARRGRARLGLAAGLMLVATPWLVPWYAVWAVALSAVEEDRAARLLALALSAYLLRDAVPL
jgi:hypothetical protein